MAYFVTLVFLSFLLQCFGDHLLHTLTGQVSSGNYSYYTLTYKGPITLSLLTKTVLIFFRGALILLSPRLFRLGDADVYVSQFLRKPTFYSNTYCLHSATCGVDVVHIPKSFKRPIGIGIYGHSSYDLSRYILEVILRENAGENGGTAEAVVGEEVEEEFEDDAEHEVPFKEPHVSFSFEDRYKFREPTRRKISIRYPENDQSGARIEDFEEESKEEEHSFFWSVVWTLMELVFELFFL